MSHARSLAGFLVALSERLPHAAGLNSIGVSWARGLLGLVAVKVGAIVSRNSRQVVLANISVLLPLLDVDCYPIRQAKAAQFVLFGISTSLVSTPIIASKRVSPFPWLGHRREHRPAACCRRRPLVDGEVGEFPRTT